MKSTNTLVSYLVIAMAMLAMAFELKAADPDYSKIDVNIRMDARQETNGVLVDVKPDKILMNQVGYILSELRNGDLARSTGFMATDHRFLYTVAHTVQDQEKSVIYSIPPSDIKAYMGISEPDNLTGVPSNPDAITTRGYAVNRYFSVEKTAPRNHYPDAAIMYTPEDGTYQVDAADPPLDIFNLDKDIENGNYRTSRPYWVRGYPSKYHESPSDPLTLKKESGITQCSADFTTLNYLPYWRNWPYHKSGTFIFDGFRAHSGISGGPLTVRLNTNSWGDDYRVIGIASAAKKAPDGEQYEPFYYTAISRSIKTLASIVLFELEEDEIEAGYYTRSGNPVVDLRLYEDQVEAEYTTDYIEMNNQHTDLYVDTLTVKVDYTVFNASEYDGASLKVEIVDYTDHTDRDFTKLNQTDLDYEHETFVPGRGETATNPAYPRTSSTLTNLVDRGTSYNPGGQFASHNPAEKVSKSFTVGMDRRLHSGKFKLRFTYSNHSSMADRDLPNLKIWNYSVQQYARYHPSGYSTIVHPEEFDLRPGEHPTPNAARITNYNVTSDAQTKRFLSLVEEDEDTNRDGYIALNGINLHLNGNPENPVFDFEHTLQIEGDDNPRHLGLTSNNKVNFSLLTELKTSLPNQAAHLIFILRQNGISLGHAVYPNTNIQAGVDMRLDGEIPLYANSSLKQDEDFELIVKLIPPFLIPANKPNVALQDYIPSDYLDNHANIDVNLKSITFEFENHVIPGSAPGSAPPKSIVNAGADQTVNLEPTASTATIALSGSVSASLQEPVTTTWSVINKPEGALVSFDDASALNTAFTASAAGSYVLSLTATNGTTTALDDIIITVTNHLPRFAITGIDSQVVAGTTVTNFTITALQANGQVDTSFTGTVHFGGTAGIAGTSANFVDGVLRGVSVIPVNVGSGLTLTVDDGTGRTGSRTFDVVPIYVDAGYDELITASEPSLTLDGYVSYGGDYTSQWTVAEGPIGGAAFENVTSLNSNVFFSIPGDYKLRLTVTYGSEEIFKEVTIIVNHPPAWLTNGDRSGDSAEFTKVDAFVGEGYVGNLNNDAVDYDGHELIFTKVESGPAWLTVDSNGQLSGMPSSSDLGLNTFYLTLTDGRHGTPENPIVATMHITVRPAADAAVPGPVRYDYHGWPFDASTHQNGAALRQGLEGSFNGYETAKSGMSALVPQEYSQRPFGPSLESIYHNIHLLAEKFERLTSQERHRMWWDNEFAYPMDDEIPIAIAKLAMYRSQLNSYIGRVQQTNWEPSFKTLTTNYAAGLKSHASALSGIITEYQSRLATAQPRIVPSEYRFAPGSRVPTDADPADPLVTDLRFSGFDDDLDGASVIINRLVTYKLLFGNDIDAATLDASDLINRGTATLDFGAITEILPGIFTIEVTPTTAGTIQLAINAGATISDAVGNSLNTSVMMSDDNITFVHLLARVYEPFDYTVGLLNGQSGTSEIGLAGVWAAHATSSLITAGSLEYGTLPTVGGKLQPDTAYQSWMGTRSIDPAALAANGLMDDGKSLWFSMVVGYIPTGNHTNSRLAVALANSGFREANGRYWIKNEGTQLGSGIGMTLGRHNTTPGHAGNGHVRATQFQDQSKGEFMQGNIIGSWENYGFTYGRDEHGLVFGRIQWAADPSQPDTIEIFQAKTDRVVPDLPTSVLHAVLDQSTFDTLTIMRGDMVVLDEIRFGGSLQAVGGFPNSRPYWLTNSGALDFPAATVAVAYTGGTLAHHAYDPNGDSLTFRKVSGPAWLKVAPDGTLSGTPTNLDFGMNTFTMDVYDGNSHPALVNVNIAVNYVNVAPVAGGQSVTTEEDTAIRITLTGTDGDLDPLRYSIVSSPTKGTLSGTAPYLTYTPAPNANGADRFTFRVNDGTVASATATVSITVTAVNDAPLAFSQSVTTAEDTSKRITLTGTDNDLDDLIYTIISPPSKGTLSGTAPYLTYTPAPNTNGADSFTFKVNDGTVDSATVTVSITVTAVNNAPVAIEQSVTTEEDTPIRITLTGTDGDMDDLIYTIISPPSKGTLSGTAPDVTYMPDFNTNGADSFTFKVSDGTVESATVTVSITVTSVNDAPVFTNNPLLRNDATVSEAYSDTIAGSAIDADAEGSLTYAKVSGPAWLMVSADGALSGTPDHADVGVNTFTVSVTDIHGPPVQVSLNIKVNSAPVSPYQYTQNFNSMGIETGQLPFGWSVHGNLGGSNISWANTPGIPVSGVPSAATFGTVNNTLIVTNQADTAVVTSNFQAFNAALPGSTADRALAFSPTGGAGMIFQLSLPNTLGQAIKSLDISYDIRRFKTTAVDNELPGYQLFYSTDNGTTWINVAVANPSLSGSGVAVPSTAGVTRVADINLTLHTPWEADAGLLFRWVDDNASQAGPDQFIGLDNVTISATEVIESPTPTAPLQYTQNFNSMGSNTGRLPTGWNVRGNLGGSGGSWLDTLGIPASGSPSAATPGTVNNLLIVTDQADTTTATSYLQAFNAALPGSTADRALATSPTTHAGMTLELTLPNTTTKSIKALEISYDIRRFKTTAVANELPGYRLFYSTDNGSTWTNVAAANPSLSGSGVAVPNAPGVTGVAGMNLTLDTPWAANANLLFRWVDDNASQTSPDQFNGLDNVSIIATEFMAEPSPAAAGQYTQNFDAMGIETGKLPLGWRVLGNLGGSNTSWANASGIPASGAISAATAGTMNNTLIVTDQANTSALVSGIQAFNAALPGSTADRALATSPSGPAGVILELSLTNDSGETIPNVEISYDIRRFQAPAVANELPGYQLFYSMDNGVTWTNVTAANPSLNGPGVAVPNTPGVTRVTGINFDLHTPWEANANLLFRWVDDNATQSSPDQFIGLDNVTVSSGAVHDNQQLFMRHDDGTLHYWFLRDGVRQSGGPVSATPIGSEWKLVDVADLNGDGHEDIIWRHENGTVAYWLLRDGVFQSNGLVHGTPVGFDWKIVAVADLNGDNHADIVWRHDNGIVHHWIMRNGIHQSSGNVSNSAVGSEWKLVDVADLNGDGHADLIWRHDNGTVARWLLRNGVLQSGANVSNTPVGSEWKLEDVADLNGDGHADIIWRHQNGLIQYWLLRDGILQSSGAVNGNLSISAEWKIVAVRDLNGDHHADLIMRHDDGTVAHWLLRDGIYQSGASISDAPLASEWLIVGEEFIPQAFLAPARSGSEVNVAVGCPTTASSIYYGDAKRWGPKFAVDSATSGNVSEGGIYHSNNDTPTDWFRVDLGAHYPISSIILFNRTGSAAITSRLDGCKIMVGKTAEISEATLFTSWTAYGTASERKFTNAAVTEGMRYVWVQRNGTRNYLHFAEIHVNVAVTNNVVAKPLPAADSVQPLMAYKEHNAAPFATAFASQKSGNTEPSMVHDGYLPGEIQYGGVFRSVATTRPFLSLVFNSPVSLKAVQIFNSENINQLHNASIFVQRTGDPSGVFTHLATWSNNVQGRILRINNLSSNITNVDHVYLRLHGINRSIELSEFQVMSSKGAMANNANFTEASLLLKKQAAITALGLNYNEIQWKADFGQWIAFQRLQPALKAMILDDMAANPQTYLDFVASGHSKDAVWPVGIVDGTPNDDNVQIAYGAPFTYYNSHLKQLLGSVINTKFLESAVPGPDHSEYPLSFEDSGHIPMDGLSDVEYAAKLEDVLSTNGTHRSLAHFPDHWETDPLPNPPEPPRGPPTPPAHLSNVQLSNLAAVMELNLYLQDLVILSGSFNANGLTQVSTTLLAHTQSMGHLLDPNSNSDGFVNIKKWWQVCAVLYNTIDELLDGGFITQAAHDQWAQQLDSALEHLETANVAPVAQAQQLPPIQQVDMDAFGNLHYDGGMGSP